MTDEGITLRQFGLICAVLAIAIVIIGGILIGPNFDLVYRFSPPSQIVEDSDNEYWRPRRGDD